jgi:hypothetical protein
MPRIRLAAPLATADGAPLQGDDRLVASTIILEVETIDQAVQLMREDPYVSAGVWSGVDVMECRELSGVWIAGERAAADGAYAALYESISTVSVLPQPSAALLVASLHDTHSIGAAGIERWGAVTYFRAASIEDAQRDAGELAVVRAGSWRASVWAVPKALGSWSVA